MTPTEWEGLQNGLVQAFGPWAMWWVALLIVGTLFALVMTTLITMVHQYGGRAANKKF